MRKQVIVFISIFVVLFILSYVALRLGNASIYLSDSMKPAIPKYSTFFYSESDGYQVEDIIVYESDMKNPVAHRVIALNEDGSFQTKGDANPSQIQSNILDETNVPLSSVLGKVTFVMNSLLLHSIRIVLILVLAFYGSR